MIRLFDENEALYRGYPRELKRWPSWLGDFYIQVETRVWKKI